jgi:hypothetical protein
MLSRLLLLLQLTASCSSPSLLMGFINPTITKFITHEHAMIIALQINQSKLGKAPAQPSSNSGKSIQKKSSSKGNSSEKQVQIATHILLLG